MYSTSLAAAEPTHPVDFSLETISGQPVKLSEFRGQWVIVNFWATWCGPCVEEIPELNLYHENHPEDVVIGVNFESLEADKLQAFNKKHPIKYLSLKLINDRPLLPFEPLEGLPTTFIITPAGEMIVKHPGPVTAEALESFLKNEKISK